MTITDNIVALRNEERWWREKRSYLLQEREYFENTSVSQQVLLTLLMTFLNFSSRHLPA